MAYKAKTVTPSVAEYDGPGGTMTFDGVTVTGRFKTFAGKPPAEMLASQSVMVQDLSGRPWPSGAQDRIGKQPNQSRLAELEGAWPDAAEKERQRFAEAKLANPDAIAKASLKRQGYSDAEIAKMVGRQNITSFPDPAELLGAVKPSAPVVQARG